MVWAGRALGLRLFGWPRSKEKHKPRFLHQHAGAFGEDAAAHGLIDRVDEAAGVAVAVDDREGDGVAIRGQRALPRRRQDGKGAVVVDEPGERGEVIGCNEAADRRFAPARIGEEGVAVAVSQARGLDVPVVPHRAFRSVRGGTQRLELAEDHQRDNARAVRWALPDVEPRQPMWIGSTNSAPKRPLAKSSSVCTPPARLSVAAMSAATGPA